MYAVAGPLQAITIVYRGYWYVVVCSTIVSRGAKAECCRFLVNGERDRGLQLCIVKHGSSQAIMYWGFYTFFINYSGTLEFPGDVPVAMNLRRR